MTKQKKTPRTHQSMWRPVKAMSVDVSSEFGVADLFSTKNHTRAFSPILSSPTSP